MSGKVVFFVVLVLGLGLLCMGGSLAVQAAAQGVEAWAWMEQAQAVQELGQALQVQAVGNLVGLCVAGMLGLVGMVGGLGLAMVVVRWKSTPPPAPPQFGAEDGAANWRGGEEGGRRAALPDAGDTVLDGETFRAIVESAWWPK